MTHPSRPCPVCANDAPDRRYRLVVNDKYAHDGHIYNLYPCAGQCERTLRIRLNMPQETSTTSAR